MKRFSAVLIILCMLFSVTAYADHPISYVPGAYERMEDHMDCGHMWIIDHANHYVCAYCNSYGGCVPVIPEKEEERYNAHFEEYYDESYDVYYLVLIYDDVNMEDILREDFYVLDDGKPTLFRIMNDGKIDMMTVPEELFDAEPKAGDKYFFDWSDGRALWESLQTPIDPPEVYPV